MNAIGAVAASTERIGLVTGVTCPSCRCHPAIIAQAAATVALLSDGRFTPGIGAGEALEIIRLLWPGGYRSYDGKHRQLEDAQVFDLPATLPLMPVAAGGPRAARIAAELGDGLFGTEPKASLVDAYHQAGGGGPLYAEVPAGLGARPADRRAGGPGHHPVGPRRVEGHERAAEPGQLRRGHHHRHAGRRAGAVRCGPDVARHLQVAQQFVDAGFDHLVLQNAGPDPEGFLDLFTRELAAPLRALTPG